MKNRNEFRMNPEGWELKSLRHLGRFRKGLTITKADLLDYGIPCLNYGEVHSRYPFEVNQDVQPLRCVDPAYEESNSEALVNAGDFVFADTSEDFEGVGNFTLVTGDSPLFAGYHTIIYCLGTKVDPRFLAYSLDSFFFRTQLRLSVKGIKVFSITQEILRGARVLLPPMEQQRSIAKLLDGESARIDTLIAKKTRFIELLKEKRQAVITKAVTKGLDESVEMKDSGEEWIGEIPKHWTSAGFNFVARVTEGLVDPKDPLYQDMVLIAPNHIESGTGRLLAQETAAEQKAESGKYTCKKGAVIYSKIRPALAKVVIAPCDCLCSADMYPMSCSEKADPEWLFYLMLSAPFTAWAVLESDRVAMPKINRESLSGLRVFIPPIEEQKHIVSYVNALLRRIDSLTEKTQRSIELLKEKRSALITAAVTGKIDVREAA